jgi:hypothetical protein
MRNQTYDLMEQLKYTSPLGSMLRGIRASQREINGAVVGIGTIRKLEAVGITTLQQVSQTKLADMERLGIATRYAKQIISYVRRRLR